MVDVYFNRTRWCFSIREAGKVFAYTSRILLQDVKFTVRESGRQRYLLTEHKNVHAWITGEPLTWLDLDAMRMTHHIPLWESAENLRRIFYHPKKVDTFRLVDVPDYTVTWADRVLCMNDIKTKTPAEMWAWRREGWTQ